MRILLPVPLALLFATHAWAATPLSGTDSLGRHYAITLAGKPDRKALPAQQDMVAGNYDVAHFILDVCVPQKAVTQCDVYAQGGEGDVNGPGYLIATNGPADHGITYFQFIGIPSGRGYAPLTCVGARPKPLSGPGIVEGRGPIILKKEGADLRESYDSRFGCKVSLDEKALHIGGIAFAGGK